jgi:hypothetical protein
LSDILPPGFQVPAGLLHPRFRLRMLKATDAEADYEAVMASQTRLREGSPHGWPRPGFTLAENLADLTRHEREFHDRVAFAYTVLAPQGTPVLGCVYIHPRAPVEPDGNLTADAYLWVRDEHHPELTGTLFEAVARWLDAGWPFAEVRWIRTEYYRSEDASTE